MNAASSTATASASDASAPPVTVASTVPLANADQLAQTSVSASQMTASTEAPADAGGLPQLNTANWPGQMIWMLIIFAVFYALIAGVFAPRLRKVIDKRGSTIAEDLANARAIRDEAHVQAKEAAAETAAAHASAKKLASEAIARSNAEVAAAQAAEDVKLNARLSEAEARIKSARDEAMSHVREIASDTASALVQKLTGKAATQAALKSAYQKV